VLLVVAWERAVVAVVVINENEILCKVTGTFKVLVTLTYKLNTKMFIQKNQLIGILLLITQFCIGQEADSSFKKKALTSLDVQAFFSLYTQEGTHSAVTGGEGDEHLDVYHTGANLAYGINASLMIFDISIDVISSPSTDKINFIESSPSAEDNHFQARLGYQYDLKKHKVTFGAAYLLGVESDYWSTGISAWFNWLSSDKTRAISVATDLFFDDLRWGRLSPRTEFKPTRLIYPVELRYKNWFDIYHRNSYNLNLNLRQDINKRLKINIGIGATYQEGLLSTPFHRVYFRDLIDPRVENLPQQRIRLPLSIAANWFFKQAVVFQPSYRFYWDNFGILAHTLAFQTAIKPNNKLTLYPFVRAYYQIGSPYFAPYEQHLSTATFYTSDYDFSTLASFKAGLGIGWYPDARLGKKSKFYFNNVILRYAFFYRTDGLSAHIISLQVGLKK
jgi:hypothetical protein